MAKNTRFLTYMKALDCAVKSLIEKEPERFTAKTTPTEFEGALVLACKKVLEREQIKATIDYTEGGHAFPDIVIRFDTDEKLGIEVKSSVQAKAKDDNWEILGNSILGTTRVLVDDLYIYFIRVNRNGVFTKYNRYEDSVSDVVVTHSPRYKINLGIEPEESFFNRSGISYALLKESSNPIGLITDYFREQGETAWWISESVPATVKLWNDISIDMRNQIIAKAFILFPELFDKTNVKKYKRMAKWLVIEYSIVNISIRDTFSAGGKVSINFAGMTYNFPRLVQTLVDYSEQVITAFENIEDEELAMYWEEPLERIQPLNSKTKKIAHWLELVCNHIGDYDESEQIEQYIKLIFLKV